MTVGHDDEEGTGCSRRACGRTLKLVLTKDTEEQLSGPQALGATPFYLPGIQKWLIYDGRGSKKKGKGVT
eukprot:12908727-Prorocentrum_lima.AAC.1